VHLLSADCSLVCYVDNTLVGARYDQGGDRDGRSGAQDKGGRSAGDPPPQKGEVMFFYSFISSGKSPWKLEKRQNRGESADQVPRIIYMNTSTLNSGGSQSTSR